MFYNVWNENQIILLNNFTDIFLDRENVWGKCLWKELKIIVENFTITDNNNKRHNRVWKYEGIKLRIIFYILKYTNFLFNPFYLVTLRVWSNLVLTAYLNVYGC